MTALEKSSSYMLMQGEVFIFKSMADGISLSKFISRNIDPTELIQRQETTW
jgi:hypothetical protein